MEKLFERKSIFTFREVHGSHVTKSTKLIWFFVLLFLCNKRLFNNKKNFNYNFLRWDDQESSILQTYQWNEKEQIMEDFFERHTIYSDGEIYGTDR